MSALRVCILAAGASSRLGSPKALAEIMGRTVLEHLAHGARAIDPSPLVITGGHAGSVEAAARELGLEPVRNPRWQSGRTGSVQVAARAAPGAHLMIAPADVPLALESTFRALRDAWADLDARDEAWLAPFLSGPDGERRFGHPVVIGKALCQGPLAELDPAAPLNLVRGHGRPLAAVEVQDEGIIDDLDTPMDLEALRRRLQSSARNRKEVPPG